MSADTLDLIIRGILVVALVAALARFYEASYRREQELNDLIDALNAASGDDA